MPDIDVIHPQTLLFVQTGSVILIRKPAAFGQLKRLYEQKPVLLLFFRHHSFLRSHYDAFKLCQGFGMRCGDL
jgi:hypothetical protein